MNWNQLEPPIKTTAVSKLPIPKKIGTLDFFEGSTSQIGRVAGCFCEVFRPWKEGKFQLSWRFFQQIFISTANFWGAKLSTKKTKANPPEHTTCLFQWETSSAPAKGFPGNFFGQLRRGHRFFFGRGWRQNSCSIDSMGFCAETGLGNFHISLPLGVKRNIDEHLSIKFVGKNTLFNLDLFGHGAWKKWQIYSQRLLITNWDDPTSTT